MTERTVSAEHKEFGLEPVINLLATRTGSAPPERLAEPVTATPYFEIGAEGFLLRTPGGGRLHYAAGSGLSLSAPPGRADDDLAPFVETSVFGAAAWIDGQVPLKANALRLADGRLLLIASASDERDEELTAAMADALGLAAASGPVIVVPDGPARACTNGSKLSLKPESVKALTDVISASVGAPVRPGAPRLRIDLPVIDGKTLHACAALICINSVNTGERTLETLGALAAIPLIKKHIFLPQVGKAIWGKDVVAAALLVVANLMPVLRLSLPEDERPSHEMVTWLMGMQENWSGQ
jgi:hypothetical protein